MRKTSIIILTHNNLEYTKDCLDSIKKYTTKNTYEIIVVDNMSTDGTREYLEKIDDIKLILNNNNVGFPKGCNQGIKKADPENDILLLNNDTIVTSDWLTNLKICLYSSDEIGATGSVCNHNENLQGVDFTYDNFELMQKQAKENNVSNPEKWEEKNFLIGFCLLIKREVINKLKELDEGYTPGYIEDNDLSLQILKLGYKLMLCHDSFIHHYLGSGFRKDLTKFYPILNKNREYFYNKWKFSTFTFDEIKDASFPIVKDDFTNILDINCGIGSTILKLKYLYKDMIIDGVETDSNKREISKLFTNVYSSIDEIDKQYDCIFIGNHLEYESDINSFIKKIEKYLKPNGYIIGEIKNTSSIINITKLLKDEWYELDKNTKNHFTISDIARLFDNLNYHNGYTYSWCINLDNEQKKLVEFLNKNYPKRYETVCYAYRFQKK